MQPGAFQIMRDICYVLTPVVDGKKTKVGEVDQRCLLWIRAQWSAHAAHKMGIRRVSGVGKCHWLPGNQWNAAQLFIHRACAQWLDAPVGIHDKRPSLLACRYLSISIAPRAHVGKLRALGQSGLCVLAGFEQGVIVGVPWNVTLDSDPAEIQNP